MSAIKIFYFRGGKSTPQKCTPHFGGGRGKDKLKFQIGTSIFYSRYESSTQKYLSVIRNFFFHLKFQIPPPRQPIIPGHGVNFYGVGFPPCR